MKCLSISPNLRIHFPAGMRNINVHCLFVSDEEFLEFFNFLNSFHPTIKFDEPQHNSETNSCEFLDLTNLIENGKVVTELISQRHSKTKSPSTKFSPSRTHHYQHSVFNGVQTSQNMFN